MITNRIKAPVMAMVAMVALSGCDLLDVDNPNNLVEESIRQQAVAEGVVNGSLQMMSEAVSSIWQPTAVVSDELYWIGSRDAWQSLDQGDISDPTNEFTDAAFPDLGRAVWTAQNAVEIMDAHFADPAPLAADDFAYDRARAYMYRGVILMVTVETQEDMTFSFKMEDGPAVSTGNATIGSEGQHAVPSMDAVMDLAISSLETAKSEFERIGETDLAIDATALLARAEMSQEILAARYSPSDAPLAFADAVPHAQEVLTAAGAAADYRLNLEYSPSTASCTICSWVSDRKENQFDLSLVEVDDANDVTAIALDDPITGEPDMAVQNAMNQFRGGNYLDPGSIYADLSLTTARLMNLIVAEHELATNGGGAGSGFEDAINALRDIDNTDAGYDFASDGDAANDLDILQHHRRANTLIMGLRLPDMYRWGITTTTASAPEARWQPGSTTLIAPGTMLPITIIECRANGYLDGNTCDNVTPGS